MNIFKEIRYFIIKNYRMIKFKPMFDYIVESFKRKEYKLVRYGIINLTLREFISFDSFALKCWVHRKEAKLKVDVDDLVYCSDCCMVFDEGVIDKNEVKLNEYEDCYLASKWRCPFCGNVNEEYRDDEE